MLLLATVRNKAALLGTMAYCHIILTTGSPAFELYTDTLTAGRVGVRMPKTLFSWQTFTLSLHRGAPMLTICLDQFLNDAGSAVNRLLDYRLQVVNWEQLFPYNTSNCNIHTINLPSQEVLILTYTLESSDLYSWCFYSFQHFYPQRGVPMLMIFVLSFFERHRQCS